MISSKRLKFKYIEKEDFDSLYEILKDPEVMYAWEHDFTEEDVNAWIEKRCALYELFGYDYFLATDKLTGKVVGQIGILDEIVNGEHITGIGYILKKEFWHKGLATEGAEAMIEYAFNVLKKDKIIATIRPENISSCKVAERIGMKIESDFIKVYQGKNMRHLVYTITKEEYGNRRV